VILILYNFIRGWVGPIAGVDGYEKTRPPPPPPSLDFNYRTVQHAASRSTVGPCHSDHSFLLLKLINRLRRTESSLRRWWALSLSINAQHFTKAESSLPCSQEPATGLQPEADESSVSLRLWTSPSWRAFLTLITHCLSTSLPNR
jgi:hypothetical protein